MRSRLLLLVLGLVAVAGCGDDEAPAAGARSAGAASAQTGAAAAPAKTETRTAAKTAAARLDGTKITVGDSQFGEMLFDSKQQAIYIFENDPRGRSVCYEDCATAWPPVFTDGQPVPGNGLTASLLGTVKRRDGKRQVTYAGQPLYYYAHERPGKVRCHNVNLNGGLWWVVAPNGKRRA